jgi:hypothetical protein
MPPFSPQKYDNSSNQLTGRILTGAGVRAVRSLIFSTTPASDLSFSGFAIVKCCFFASFYASDDVSHFCELDFYWKNLMRISSRKSSCLTGNSESHI